MPLGRGAGLAVTRQLGGMENGVYETPGNCVAVGIFCEAQEGTKKLVRWLQSGYMRGGLDSGFL